MYRKLWGFAGNDTPELNNGSDASLDFQTGWHASVPPKKLGRAGLGPVRDQVRDQDHRV